MLPEEAVNRYRAWEWVAVDLGPAGHANFVHECELDRAVLRIMAVACELIASKDGSNVNATAENDFHGRKCS